MHNLLELDVQASNDSMWPHFLQTVSRASTRKEAPMHSLLGKNLRIEHSEFTSEHHRAEHYRKEIPTYDREKAERA